MKRKGMYVESEAESLIKVRVSEINTDGLPVTKREVPDASTGQ